MRTVLALCALLALAAAFAACGEDDEASGTSTNNVAAKESGEGEKAGEGEGGRSVWDTERTFSEEHPGQARYGSPPLEFEADPSGKTAFTAKEVTAKEGNVTIEFRNPQSTPHNVAIEALPSHGKVVTATVKDDGFAAKTITLNTDEKFIFYCTVPGHREAGMEGVVTVKPS